MPLLDHFHSSARVRAPWESLGHSWVTKVMAYLNRLLPKDRYHAFSCIHLGGEAEVEADIAEFEVPGDWSATGDGGSATLTVPPVVTIEAAIPDEFEVEVKDAREGMSMVGAIEFISPGNKDRPETREKLVSKVLTYLDLGVVLVDIVTDRLANLHNELVVALKGRKAARLPDDAPTYVAGYRPTREDDRWTIDMWPYVVPVGGIVPTVPLALKGGPLVPVDLEGTYCAALADHNL